MADHAARSSLLLRGVRLMDQDGDFSDPLDVSTRNGLIVSVGRNLSTSTDVTQVDAAGLWLMPGVFDCHVHLALQSLDAEDLRRAPLTRPTPEIERTLHDTLMAGVTFVRDAGGLGAGVRDAVARGRVSGPRIQTCVAAIDAADGPLDGSLTTPRHDGEARSIAHRHASSAGTGAEATRVAVRAAVDAGADWIKLMATGGVLSEGAGLQKPRFTADAISAAVAEAARYGKDVMAHAIGGRALRAAIECGVRSIEHGIFLTEEEADLMSRRGCFLVPTLAIYHELAGMAARGQLNGTAAHRAEEAGRRLGKAVALANAAGVRIAMGTDFGDRDQHGHNLTELYHLHRAGLSVEDALQAGTFAGAQLCGVSDRLGRLAPGFIFDAVLLDEDPGDLSCFCRPGTITGVFKGGVPVLAHPRLANLV
jgi:imidazolonepropionase-like amidohydrolase